MVFPWVSFASTPFSMSFSQIGRTVSFGSDAHVPHLVGDKFDLAVAIVEDAGFTAAKSPEGFWTSGSPL